MAIHECKYCNYSTLRLYDFNRHKKSKKHIKNMNENIHENKKIESETCFICDNCEESFKTKQLLTLHKKQNICQTSIIIKDDSDSNDSSSSDCDSNDEYEKNPKKNKAKNNKTDSELYKKDEEIKRLNHQVSKLINLMEISVNIANENAQATKKSMSAISYAMKHFGKAPPIKMLQDEDIVLMLTYDKPNCIEEILIQHFKSKTFYEFISNIIISTYKKDDPTQQSMWATDTSRLCFIVKQIIDDSDGWITDKSGTKVKKFVITPILSTIKDLIKTYIIDQNDKIQDLSLDDLETDIKFENIAWGSELIDSINKNIATKEILKIISNHFGLVLPKKRK